MSKETEKLLEHRVHGLQKEYEELMTEKEAELGQAVSEGDKSEKEGHDL